MTETEAKTLYEHKPKVHIDDPEFGLVVSCAVRYGLGRMTYIVAAITDYIIPLVPYMDLQTLYCMNRDITSHAETNDLGMKCDAEHWLELRTAIQREIDRRKAE